MSVADVAEAGKGRYVTNVKYIRGVSTATVMELHGNVFATLTGVDCCVIKVSESIEIIVQLNCKLYE